MIWPYPVMVTIGYGTTTTTRRCCYASPFPSARILLHLLPLPLPLLPIVMALTPMWTTKCSWLWPSRRPWHLLRRRHHLRSNWTGNERRHRAASTVPGLRSGSPMWRACSPDARGADWTSSRAPPTVSLLSSSASSGSEAENEPPPPLPLAGRVEKRRRDEQVKSLRDQFIGGSTAGPIDALLDLHGAPAALRDEIRRSVTDQLARMWDDIADRLAPSGVRSEPATQNGWAFPPPTVQERRPPLPLAPRSAARDPPLAPLPLYATPAPTASLSFSSALTESTSLDRNRYNKMRLIELKTLAKTAGVKVSGTKDQVIDRLLDHGNSIHLLSSLSIEGSAEAPKRNGNAQVQVLQWIKSHADIYDRVLMFDPLDLDEIHSQLGADGIRIGKPALVSLFDEHSIIHSAKSNGRWGRA
ncbi:hypothetical protein BC828DRAFT_279131 [Blastocladiella britannica]|nr:hypothetical protein BC828DRAFT_279131 [Blastocladiella britannica]